MVMQPASGKPVITTKHAGIPELVEEVLVEEQNVDQLKRAIEYLLDNQSKWVKMGRKNQEIIRSRYSKDNVKILVDVFKSVNGQ